MKSTFGDPKKRMMYEARIKEEDQYYRIEVNPAKEFLAFRIQELKGNTKRITGVKESGTWGTQALLIDKKEAHIEDNKLVGDKKEVKKILSSLTLRRIKDGIFKNIKTKSKK